MLTKKQENFCNLLIETGNASEAYRRSYNCTNQKEATINDSASKLAARPEIFQRVQAARKKAADVVMFGVVDVLREWVKIATADVREFMVVRTLNCRFCHGIGHKYQWKNEDEFARACAEVIDHNNAITPGRGSRSKRRKMPTDDGAYGFVFNGSPHKECPECRGEGVVDVKLNDLTNLSEAGVALYNGVKTTQHGIEIKLRDKDGALANIAKFLGMSDEGRGKIPAAGGDANVGDALPADPIAAATFYRELLKKS